MYRQGDVFIFPVKDPGSENVGPEVKRDNGRVVLQYGEVTGHAHAIHESPVHLFDFSDDFLKSNESFRKNVEDVIGAPLDPQIDRLLTVGEMSALVHEEHDTIPIPPGTYIARRQHEYSDRERERYVED